MNAIFQGIRRLIFGVCTSDIKDVVFGYLRSLRSASVNANDEARVGQDLAARGRQLMGSRLYTQ